MLGSIKGLKRKWLGPVEKSRVFQQYLPISAPHDANLSVSFGEVRRSELIFQRHNSGGGGSIPIARPHPGLSPRKAVGDVGEHQKTLSWQGLRGLQNPLGQKVRPYRQKIHLVSAPSALLHKDITVEVITQEQILLWPSLPYQEQDFSDEHNRPYCRGQFVDTNHNSAIRADCLHVGEDRHWWTRIFAVRPT